MHGFYRADRNAEPRLAPSLAQASTWGFDAYQPVRGGRWRLQAPPEAFTYIPPSGGTDMGAVIGRIGVKTTGLSGCVVIAAMQIGQNGRWEQYYFTHQDATEWSRNPQHRLDFRASITAPANAFLIIANQGLAGATEVLDTVRNWTAPAIPANQSTVYMYDNDGTFALQLTDGSVGEF